MKIKRLFLVPLILVSSILDAQDIAAFNQFIPGNLIDSRSSISKNILGVGPYLQAHIGAGIKNSDACSEADYGRLQIEFFWYNPEDEGGKMMLQMMKDMNGVQGQKDDFFDQSSFENDQAQSEELAGGTLRYVSTENPCINTISGATGKTAYATKALFFAFTGNLIIKINLSAGIRVETARSLIIQIAEKAGKFDFSIYKTTVAQGKD
jgi:hypothetical protein